MMQAQVLDHRHCGAGTNVCKLRTRFNDIGNLVACHNLVALAIEEIARGFCKQVKGGQPMLASPLFEVLHDLLAKLLSAKCGVQGNRPEQAIRAVLFYATTANQFYALIQAHKHPIRKIQIVMRQLTSCKQCFHCWQLMCGYVANLNHATS